MKKLLLAALLSFNTLTHATPQPAVAAESNFWMTTFIGLASAVALVKGITATNYGVQLYKKTINKPKKAGVFSILKGALYLTSSISLAIVAYCCSTKTC